MQISRTDSPLSRKNTPSGLRASRRDAIFCHRIDKIGVEAMLEARAELPCNWGHSLNSRLSTLL